jgi:transcription elongation factor GreA
MAEVINPADVSCDKIRFSAGIKVEDDDTKEVQHYQIVGHEESDINSGLLSYKSPLARALINKKVGDFIEFETPKSSKAYTILEINYI